MSAAKSPQQQLRIIPLSVQHRLGGAGRRLAKQLARGWRTHTYLLLSDSHSGKGGKPDQSSLLTASSEGSRQQTLPPIGQLSEDSSLHPPVTLS